jgi:NAD(P)-dependent dehydrogenase (short-subunit alcohol dehydrogenase family)
MIVVNGVTGSIGQTIATFLTEKGYQVVGVGRDQDKLKKIQSDLQGSLAIAHIDTKAENQISQFLEQFNELDLVDSTLEGYVHCVGAFERFSSPLDIVYEEWENSINTNLTLNFIWNQWALKEMITYKRGSIVNLVSQASKTGGFSPITPYAAAKGGVVSMTKNLSNWAGQFNIRVNCVSPGFVENQMMNQNLDQDLKREMLTKVPLKRFSKNIEIAHAVHFLISPESEYITGTILDVAGGLTNI